MQPFASAKPDIDPSDTKNTMVMRLAFMMYVSIQSTLVMQQQARPETLSSATPQWVARS
jgi:hypothetical protein